MTPVNIILVTVFLGVLGGGLFLALSRPSTPPGHAVDDRQKCANCRFWSKLNVWDRGECRRRAPLDSKNAYDGSVSIPRWPETMDPHWCGEHEPR